MRVWIAQCLCGPNRHCIVALAGEYASEVAAQELVEQLRVTVVDLIAVNAMGSFCAICGTDEGDGGWRYELGRTRFVSMGQAEQELRRNAAEQALANLLFGTHGGKPPTKQ